MHKREASLAFSLLPINVFYPFRDNLILSAFGMLSAKDTLIVLIFSIGTDSLPKDNIFDLPKLSLPAFPPFSTIFSTLTHSHSMTPFDAPGKQAF